MTGAVRAYPHMVSSRAALVSARQLHMSGEKQQDNADRFTHLYPIFPSFFCFLFGFFASDFADATAFAFAPASAKKAAVSSSCSNKKRM